MTQEVHRVLLVAALSFEERCLASLAAWRHRAPRRLDSAIFFSYEDRATQISKPASFVNLTGIK